MELLGLKVKDKVTGFEGIAANFAEHLFGCNQYSVLPQTLKDGKAVEGEWFDEGRLEKLKGEQMSGTSFPGFGHELGVEAEEKISGMKGIITTRVFSHFSGDKRYGITFKSKDGTKTESEWFSEARLKSGKKKIEPKSVQSKTPGGPQRMFKVR